MRVAGASASAPSPGEAWRFDPAFPKVEELRKAMATATPACNLTGDWEFQGLIAEFLQRARGYGDTAMEFGLPWPFTDAEHRGKDFTSTSHPAWAHRTRTRLELHTKRFWMEQFKQWAPDLHFVAHDRDLAWEGDAPRAHTNFWYRAVEPEHQRSEELFAFSRKPENLKALMVNPEQYSVIVDGHEFQVPPCGMHVLSVRPSLALPASRSECPSTCAHAERQSCCREQRGSSEPRCCTTCLIDRCVLDAATSLLLVLPNASETQLPQLRACSPSRQICLMTQVLQGAAREHRAPMLHDMPDVSMLCPSCEFIPACVSKFPVLMHLLTRDISADAQKLARAQVLLTARMEHKSCTAHALLHLKSARAHRLAVMQAHAQVQAQ